MPQTDFLGTCEILMSPPRQRAGACDNGSKIADGAHPTTIVKKKLSDEWYRA